MRDSVIFVGSGAEGAWERLALDFTAHENGYLQIFVANESETTNAWFDDLKISHTKNLIVQENHYYPFGLELAGLEKNNKPDFRYLYNAGTERERSFGLQWDETDWRGYDAQVGRFHQIDPFSYFLTGITPYNYAFNNPIYFNDPSGLCPECDKHYKDKKKKPKVGEHYYSQGGKIYTYTKDGWVKEGGTLEEITITAKKEKPEPKLASTPTKKSPSKGDKVMSSRHRAWDIIFGKRHTSDGQDVDADGRLTGFRTLTGTPDLGPAGKGFNIIKGVKSLFGGGRKAAQTGKSLVPLTDEVFEQAMHLESLGKIEKLGAYSIYGNQALVGNVYIRNVFLIESSAAPSIKGFKALVKTLEQQARAAGATEIQITGLAVKNNGFFKSNLARLLGYRFRQVNSETVLFTKSLK